MATASPRLALILGVLGLAGCAVTPLQPLEATHPASPQAQEAARYHRTVALAEDPATRATRDLIKGEEAPPAAGDMSSMPGMAH